MIIIEFENLPSWDGQSLMEKSWEEIDSLLKKEFSGGGQIRILSRTMMSPSLKNGISVFGQV